MSKSKIILSVGIPILVLGFLGGFLSAFSFCDEIAVSDYFQKGVLIEKDRQILPGETLDTTITIDEVREYRLFIVHSRTTIQQPLEIQVFDPNGKIIQTWQNSKTELIPLEPTIIGDYAVKITNNGNGPHVQSLSSTYGITLTNDEYQELYGSHCLSFLDQLQTLGLFSLPGIVLITISFWLKKLEKTKISRV